MKKRGRRPQNPRPGKPVVPAPESGATILVVEDNPITRKMVRVTLETEGYRVLEASDGRSAIDLARSDPPALVIQDLLLPDMNGLELLTQLRALPAATDIPVLACSGLMPQVQEARTLRAGFTEYLFKPVEPSRLVQAVAAHLPAKAGEEPAPGKRRRVLVVDDDPVQLKLEKIILEHRGFSVTTAADGAEALKVARARPPEAIVSDLLMPVMGGLDLCLEIRKDPRLAHVPVVLTSATFAHLEDEDRKVARDAGADAFVVRTPSLDEVSQALSDSLERRTAPQQPLAGAEQTRAAYAGRLIKQLERQAALNASLAQHAARENAQLSIIAGVAEVLSRELDLDAALREVLGRTLDASGVSIGAVYLTQADGGLRLHSYLGYSGSGTSAVQEFFGHPELLEQAMRGGEAVVIPSARLSDSQIKSILSRSGSRSLCLIPLSAGGEAQGVLVLQSSSIELDKEWVASAKAVGVQLAQAVRLGRTLGRLTESERRYRELWNNAPVGLYRSRPDGRLLDVNDALLRMLGYPTLEGLQSINAQAQYLDPEDLGRWRRTLEKRGLVLDYEFQIRRADGGVIWVSNNAHMVQDADGKLLYYEGALTEITQRKQAEQALRESEERFRQLAENIKEAFFITELQSGRLLYVSPTYEEMWGIPAAELYADQKLWFERVHPEDRSVLRAAMKGVSEGSARAVNFRIVRSNGTTRWARARAFPIPDKDRLVGVVEDITELRRAEEQATQAQKMEAVGRLAGGVAHDFNNLLTVILGEVELLMVDLPPDSHMLGPMEEVKKAANRAAILTRQLLAFSRRQIIEPVVFDLNDVVKEMHKMLARLIGEDINLTMRLGKRPKLVRADRGQIEQVLANLVVNARDAMPKGGSLTLHTELVTLDEDYAQSHAEVTPGGYAMLAVSDTGTGMTEEVKVRIFEPFFTTKERGKGTGLGLATSFGIVKQAGGHLSVYSEVGVGTTIRVYLPRVAGAETAAVTLETRELPQGNETILLVEDEVSVRRIAARALTSLGYEVLQARNGEEAEQLLTSHKGIVHLLFTDVVLPGIGGRELADRVRAAHPRIRLLFASGYTDDVILQHRLIEHDIALLQKPFTRESLAQKVREALDSKAG